LDTQLQIATILWMAIIRMPHNGPASMRSLGQCAGLCVAVDARHCACCAMSCDSSPYR